MPLQRVANFLTFFSQTHGKFPHDFCLEGRFLFKKRLLFAKIERNFRSILAADIFLKNFPKGNFAHGFTEGLPFKEKIPLPNAFAICKGI
jgi:hypothetical protein